MSEHASEQPGTGETAPAPQPRIWVGSLLDYTNGVLHGEWLDADRDPAAIRTDISAMLAASPTTAQTGEVADEAGIFDHEHFGELRIDEQESLNWVSAVARGIRRHGLAFSAWADIMQDIDALDGFEDNYLGHYDSLTAYTEQLADDAGYNDLLDQALPDSIRPYVHLDTEAIARDMSAGGDVHVLPADNDGVWIFDAH